MMDWLLFIRKAVIDRDFVDEDSYLFDIAAIRSIQELEFHAPITLFAGGETSGSSPGRTKHWGNSPPDTLMAFSFRRG